MKEDIIDFIEVLILKSPPEERPHWVSHFVVPNANELMIKIKTKEGLEGFGLATSYTDIEPCLLYTSPSPRDLSTSRMPSSA